MSNWLLIIFVIGSCVTLGALPSKFSKCCFRYCIRSFLAGSFQFSFRNVLPSAHFLYHLPCYPRLSIFIQVSKLIDLISYLYSICSFRYIIAYSFCDFLSFRVLILVGFLLLHLEVVFTSACFFPSTNVSYVILRIALSLVGMHCTTASKWALTKFWYSE